MQESINETPREFISNEVKEDVKNIILSFCSLLKGIITILSNLGLIPSSILTLINIAIGVFTEAIKNIFI